MSMQEEYKPYAEAVLRLAKLQKLRSLLRDVYVRRAARFGSTVPMTRTVYQRWLRCAEAEDLALKRVNDMWRRAERDLS